MQVLKRRVSYCWSWGARNYRADIYNNMAALTMQVSDFIHKGKVVVAYNRGQDLYEVYCINLKGDVVNQETEVYCDTLVDVLDRMIEKNIPKEQYEKQISQWMRSL